MMNSGVALMTAGLIAVVLSGGAATPVRAGISVDQEGNVYVSEVANGRVQKFRPRAEANPAFLLGKPIYSAWK